MSADAPVDVSSDPYGELRQTVARACRILAARGLVDGILGHVSARVDDRRLLIRCRPETERGLAHTRPDDVRLVDSDGAFCEPSSGWTPPKELPIHVALLATRPDVNAVVHAHPPLSLLAGLAGLELRPVFGAYNIPAMRLALGGVPVYPRSVLISRRALADEMCTAMGTRPACVLRGHGITTVGPTVENATLVALDLEQLASVTVELARLGRTVPAVNDDDLRELPDLGTAFNDTLRWNALVSELARERGTIDDGRLDR